MPQGGEWRFMKAVRCDKALEFSVLEVDRPKLKENQVLIKVKACGVCKTDPNIV